MKKIIFLLIIFSCTFIFYPNVDAAKPAAPLVSVSTNGLDITISWNNTVNADGYFLLYAPYPGIDYIADIDVADQTSLSLTLWDGAAFYIAVQAYNNEGTSNFSNIEFFLMESLSVSYEGTWRGLAKSDTPYDKYGDSCGSADMTLIVADQEISGTATDSWNEVYSLKGSIDSNGRFSGGMAYGSYGTVATFKGVISDNTGTGTWQDNYDCSGTFSVYRQ